MDKDLREIIIENLTLTEQKKPRISLCGSVLVPFDVSLDESIIEYQKIINYFVEKIKQIYPNLISMNPVIFVEDEFRKKIYNKVKKSHKVEFKQWKELTEEIIDEVRHTDYIFFIEPCLNNPDKYWKENQKHSLNTEKLGLIPKAKKIFGSEGAGFYGSMRSIVTLYADGKHIIPNVNISSETTLNDLRENKYFGEWANNPKQWTLSYINNHPDHIRTILKEDSLINNNFISHYRTVLEKKEIIEPIKSILE